MPSTRRATAPGGLVSAGLYDMAKACREAKTEVDIATPFLSANVAAYLVRACDDGKARKRRLLTALNTAAVEGGYLDLDGVEEFLAAGFEVKSLKNLHAKVLIADARWALIGSGNLTTAGSNGGNAELGIILDHAQAEAAQKAHFNRWWVAAEQLDIGWMRRLKRRTPASPARRRREGQGGMFTSPPDVDLDGFSASKHDSGYWLKILYGTDERTSAAHWRRRMWVSDRHTVREDGKIMREPSYKVGEHLVIYVSSGYRQACPAVMRVVEPPVFDSDLVEREASAHDAAKWGWVTWLEPVASKSLDRAPTLGEIGVGSQSVRQHGHIRLSRAQYRRALRELRGW